MPVLAVQTQDVILVGALAVGLVYGTLAIVTSQISASAHTKSQVWGFTAAIFQVSGSLYASCACGSAGACADSGRLREVCYYTAPLSVLLKVRCATWPGCA